MTELIDANYVIIRTFKRAVGNPSYEWVNTYECFVTVPGDATQWATIATAFYVAEAEVHTENVEYTKVTISSWEPDSVPYNPNSFLVLDVPLYPGQLTLTSDPEPRNMTLSVKRSVSFGRSGKLFYRGALQEGDVEAGASLLPILTSAAALNFTTLVSAMYGDMQDALVADGGAGSTMMLISGLDTETISGRAVTGFVVRGVTFSDPDHKYFDRA